MWARGYISLLLLLLPLFTGGCATPHVIEKISPSKGDRYHYTSAYRDNAGNIILCADDFPRSAYSFLGAESWRFVFPVEAFSKALGARPNLGIRNQSDLPVYRLPVVSASCPPPPTQNAAALSQDTAALSSITVKSIGVTDVLGQQFADMSNDALGTYFQTRAEKDAIYLFSFRRDVGKGTRRHIVYVHNEPVFAGSRAVELRPGPKEGNLAYVPLVPFAFAFDLVFGALFLIFVFPVMAFS